LNAFPKGILSFDWQFYLFRPLVYLILGGISYWGWHACQVSLVAKPQWIMAGVITGAIQTMIFILLGLATEFGNSPYGSSGWALAGNLFYVTAMLWGIEMARGYLAIYHGLHRPWLVLFVATFVFTFISIPLGQYKFLDTPLSIFELVGKTILPTLANNFLATFLALSGGPLASLAYWLVPTAFEWFSPVLPQLPWLVTAFAGTLVPALALLAIYAVANRKAAPVATEVATTPEKKKDKSVPYLWLIALALAITLLWFNTGMFGVRPFLVSGASMNPAFYAGDIVITHQVPLDTIQVNDVIRFTKYDYFILHRVIDIQVKDNQTVFITRGDNNNTNDDPVYPDQIEGKAIFSIPKVGWLAIWAREVVLWITNLV